MGKNINLVDEADNVAEMNKNLGHTSAAESSSIEYDEVFKNFVRYKCMAAVLIKCTIQEYANLGLDEIASLIVDPEYITYKDREELFLSEVKQLPTVLGTGLEKENLHDFVFAIKAVEHKDFYNEVTVNFEMQRKNTENPKIIPRAMYYGASLLRDTVLYGDSEYKGLHKVYTIWFCKETVEISCREILLASCDEAIRPYVYKNTYKFCRSIDEVPGRVITGEKEADLIEVVVVELNKLKKKVAKYQGTTDEERLMLEAFYNTQSMIRIIERDYNINLQKFRTEVIAMMDWAKVTERKVEEGRKEGKEEGRKEAKLDFIQRLIEKEGWSIEKAMDVLDIPEEERKKYSDMLMESSVM